LADGHRGDKKAKNSMFLKGLIIGAIFNGLIQVIGYLFFRHLWDHPKLIFGYHIHDSVLGLLLILIGIIMWFLNIYSHLNLFLVGFGLGIIIAHTIAGGFVFIEKGKPHCSKN
jgi:hypothetical protein